MQLNILAGSDIRQAAAVLLGERRYFADLIAAQQAVGDANAHHEILRRLPFSVFAADDAQAVTLRVNSPGAKIRTEPFGRNGSMPLARKFTDFVEVIPRELFALQPLDLLRLGFLDFAHSLSSGPKNKKPTLP